MNDGLAGFVLVWETVADRPAAADRAAARARTPTRAPQRERLLITPPSWTTATGSEARRFDGRPQATDAGDCARRRSDYARSHAAPARRHRARRRRVAGGVWQRSRTGS